jgi:hypothetical protein
MRPGTCPECGVEHDAMAPHNQQSLAYQYKFFDQYGRWPTWEDAIAHCTPEVQEATREILINAGINPSGKPKTQTLNITLELKKEETTQ